MLRKRMSRVEIDALLESECFRVLALVDQCDSGKRMEPVLIKRVRGLEDSSRFWSVYMTLDHLRIVQNLIVRVICALTHEKAHVLQPVSTAEVKPDPKAGENSVADFEESVSLIQKTIAAIPHLNTEMRQAHPWFGPLDVAGWHVLAALHLRIHRVQLERILAGLG
jgi:hypothetical protein